LLFDNLEDKADRVNGIATASKQSAKLHGPRGLFKPWGFLLMRMAPIAHQMGREGGENYVMTM